MKLKGLNYALIEKMIIENKLSSSCSKCSQTCVTEAQATGVCGGNECDFHVEKGSSF